jgi:acetamidase/formamidase
MDRDAPRTKLMLRRNERASATVYLPVLQPGAMFFLSDGRALQGDSEMPPAGD